MKINMKILVHSSLVVIGSLLACGIVIYFYFTSIFTTQVIHDGTVKLQQTADQLQYVQDDILNFSNTVIVNSRIRNNLQQYDSADAVDRLYLIFYMLHELQALTFLRNDIQGYAIITTDGMAHWKSGTYPIRDEPWYRDYQQQNIQSAFINTPYSLFYSLPNNERNPDVFAFITKIRDYNQPNRVIGEFIMELNLSKYRNLVDSGANDFEGFVWLIKDRSIIYEKQYKAFVGVMPDLRQYLQRHTDKESFNFEGPQGYYYVNQSIGNNWILLAHTPKSFIAEKSKFILYFVGAVIFLSILIIILLMSPVIRNITKPILQLNRAINQVATGNLNVSVMIKSGDEMENLGHKFNQMTVDLKKHIHESMEHQRNNQEMQFNLMLSQINPHFIYNTLNSVIYLARKHKYREIIRLMSSFIHLLQDSIKLGEKETFVTIKREIDIIDDYVQIQKYRYQDKFELIWEIEPELMTTPIPKYILQPLVENALYHGIIPKENKGTIHITIQRERHHILLIVKDDGVGIAPEVKQRLFMSQDVNAVSGDARLRHIGLDNIHKRLSILYGNELNIEVDSVPLKGTRIIIRIPIK